MEGVLLSTGRRVLGPAPFVDILYELPVCYAVDDPLRCCISCSSRSAEEASNTSIPKKQR